MAMDEDEHIARTLAVERARAEGRAVFVLQFDHGRHTTSPVPTVGGSYTRVVTAYLPDGAEAPGLYSLDCSEMARIVELHRPHRADETETGATGAGDAPLSSGDTR